MDIKSALARSSRLTRWLDSKIEGTSISSSLRFRMSAACLDQAMEHQKAIAILVRAGHNGSALALVRLAYESYVRGVWLHQCATDAEVKQYTRDKLRKEFGVIVAEIEKTPAFRAGVLSTIKKRSWRAMNSFTHSGYSQAVRRNTADAIQSNYSEQEVLEAVSFGNSIGLLAAIHIATLADNVELANSLLRKARRMPAVAA